MRQIESSLVGVGSLVIQLVEPVVVLERDGLALDADRDRPGDDIGYGNGLGGVAAEEVVGLEAAPVGKVEPRSPLGDHLLDRQIFEAEELAARVTGADDGALAGGPAGLVRVMVSPEVKCSV